MTVPPWAVARMAGCSHPGTSTQTTVTSAGPPAAATASDSPSGERASAMTTSSASPLVAEQGCLGLERHDADAAGGPGGARRREREGAGLPGGPEDGHRGGAPPGHVLGDDAGHEGGGAADVHDHEGEVG